MTDPVDSTGAGQGSAEVSDREQVGKLMHESWSATKRAQGFHGPSESCEHYGGADKVRRCGETDPIFGGICRCEYFHADFIPWEHLPEKQKDINRHAFDAVLPYFEGLIQQAEQRGRDEERALGPCGKHPKACEEDYASGEGPSRRCSVCQQEAKLRDALKAIRIALKRGEYHTARKLADKWGIYHEDLVGEMVLLRLAEEALK